MLQSWRAVFARFRALLRSDAAGVRAGFYALLLSSGGDLIAGLTLGSITATLESLPGLLVLVPAAVAVGVVPAGASRQVDLRRVRDREHDLGRRLRRDLGDRRVPVVAGGD